MIKEFEHEGEMLRIRGLEDNSGVRDAGRPNIRKWVLEHRVGNHWLRDGYVLLPNEATYKDALKRWGF